MNRYNKGTLNFLRTWCRKALSWLTIRSHSRQKAISKKSLKADAFESYLKKEGLNFFRRQDAHDSYDTVVFMTALPAGKHRLVCAVITDNSMYTLIRVHLGTAPKGPARKTFVPFLNKLNGEHAIVKYTIGSDDNVFLDVCVTSTI